MRGKIHLITEYIAPDLYETGIRFKVIDAPGSETDIMDTELGAECP